ncbi:hypothetical protein [Streptomyces prasinus]
MPGTPLDAAADQADDVRILLGPPQAPANVNAIAERRVRGTRTSRHPREGPAGG